MPRRTRPLRYSLPALIGVVLAAVAAPPGAALAETPLGTPPPQAAAPRVEFAFEFQVALSPPVVLGQTALGHRQYIPLRGGKIAGPKLTGEVLAGGWDYQLGLADGCSQLSADYFIRAQDGTIIHVLDEGLSCPPNQDHPQRVYYRPRFEAPKGRYEWLTRGTFVASVELEQADKGPPTSIRLRFYEVK